MSLRENEIQEVAFLVPAPVSPRCQLAFSGLYGYSGVVHFEPGPFQRFILLLIDHRRAFVQLSFPFSVIANTVLTDFILGYPRRVLRENSRLGSFVLGITFV